MTEFPEIERLRKHAATLVNGRAVWLDDAEQAVRDAVERVRKDHTHVSLEMWHAARREAIRECVEALREVDVFTGKGAADFLVRTMLGGEDERKFPPGLAKTAGAKSYLDVRREARDD